MASEAPLERTDGGTTPAGPGWFVLNAREAKWLDELAYEGVPDDEPVGYRQGWLPAD